MRHFLKLIEVARDSGIIDDFETFNSRQLTPQEWDSVESCAPFVFTNIGDTIVEPGTDLSDAPFPVFSIEALADEPAGEYIGQGMGVVPLYCMIAKEVSPKFFEYIVLARPKALDEYAVMKMTEKQVGPIITSFLQELPRCVLGQETTRASVKTRVGKEKRTHRLRRIIHVAPKKYARNDSEMHRHVDWTHRFEVRGHWRAVDGLGKNRDGEYCVHGFTWVVNHVRGPEGLPLVKKVRVYDGKQDSNEPEQEYFSDQSPVELIGL